MQKVNLKAKKIIFLFYFDLIKELLFNLKISSIRVILAYYLLYLVRKKLIQNRKNLNQDSN